MGWKGSLGGNGVEDSEDLCTGAGRRNTEAVSQQCPSQVCEGGAIPCVFPVAVSALEFGAPAGSGKET